VFGADVTTRSGLSSKAGSNCKAATARQQQHGSSSKVAASTRPQNTNGYTRVLTVFVNEVDAA